MRRAREAAATDAKGGARSDEVSSEPGQKGRGRPTADTVPSRSGDELLPLLPAHVPARRALQRLLLRARYLLLQRRRYQRLVLEDVDGQAILVLPDVFNPKLFRSGEFLARSLDGRLIPPGAAVLDLGTGTGIGAIVAARWARQVVAVDINPAAVRCARANAALHGLDEEIAVRRGDLFAPVQGWKFDVVLFNPPYFRGTPRDALDQAWRSSDVVERFAAGLPDHLAPGGQALLVLSTDGDTAAFLRAFRANSLAVELLAARDLVNETFMLLGLRPAGEGK